LGEQSRAHSSTLTGSESIAAALVGKVGYRFVEKNRPPVTKDISSYWDAKNLVAFLQTGQIISVQLMGGIDELGRLVRAG